MDTSVGKADNKTHRQRAEKIHKEKKIGLIQQYSDIDIQKRIHQLEIRQIELELQNNELVQTLEYELTFRKLLESYNEIVFISEINIDDTLGKFIMVNDIACKSFGYTQEEFLSMTLTNIISENKKGILTPADFQINTNRNATIEKELITKDGRKVSFELYINITQYNNKTIFQTIAHDISERKKTEQALKESDEKHRILFENNASIQLIIDPHNGQIINANPSALKFYQYDKSDFINMNINKINILPQKDILKEMQNAVLENRNYFNFKHRKANKEIHEVEVYSTPFKVNGKKILHSIIHDVTERKRIEQDLLKSEEKYRLLFENMSIGFLLSDVLFDDNITAIDFKIVATNKYISKFSVMGYKEVVGKTLKEVFPDTYIELVKKYNSVGNIGVPFQYEYFSKTYKKHIKIIAYSPQKGQFACIYEDITKQKKAEKELLYMQEYLKELLREQSIILENSPLGIAKIINRTPVWINTEMEKIFGFSKKEMIGQTTRILYNSDKLHEKIGKEAYPKLAKGLTYETAQELSCKNGEHKSIRYFGKAIDSQDLSKGSIWILEDITERKHNEQLLHQSEQKYKNLVENSGTGIIIVNSDGVYELINEMAAKQYGLTPSEIEGKSMFDFLPEQIAREYIEKNKYLIESGGRREYEDSFVLQGKTKTFLIIDQCLKDENGRNYAVQSSSIDITERREAEIALKQLNEDLEFRILDRTSELSLVNSNLKQSEKRFRDLVDLLPQSVYETDSKGKLTYVNNVSFELYKYTQNDFNKGLYIMDMIIPEQRERLMRRIPEIINDIHSIDMEYTALRKDGTTFPVLIYTSAILKKNLPVGIRGVAIDISEIKKAEKIIIESESRLQKLIDSVTDYIYSVKIENGIAIKTNHGEGCKAVTGYSKQELETDELLWFNSIYDEDKEIVTNQIRQIFTNKKPAPFEHRIVHKNGTIKWVKDTIVLHHDSNHILIGYDGLISDITNDKMTEQQNLNLILETEEKERLYFSQELHEGVGPLLSASKLYLEWLAKTTDSSKREEIQHDLENLLNESSNVIREISFKLNPHILNNFGIVYAINSFIEKIKCKSDIEYTFDSNVERRIESKIEILLYRVVNELINNTVKHSKAKNVSLSISDNVNKIEMKYSDDGIGFDVIKIKKITEGVGLFNMHNRIKTLGGSFSIKSTVTEGTSVHIVLPIDNITKPT